MQDIESYIALRFPEFPQKFICVYWMYYCFFVLFICCLLLTFNSSTSPLFRVSTFECNISFTSNSSFSLKYMQSDWFLISSRGFCPSFIISDDDYYHQTFTNCIPFISPQLINDDYYSINKQFTWEHLDILNKKVLFSLNIV